jgi:hypothetical protein
LISSLAEGFESAYPYEVIRSCDRKAEEIAKRGEKVSGSFDNMRFTGYPQKAWDDLDE